MLFWADLRLSIAHCCHYYPDGEHCHAENCDKLVSDVSKLLIPVCWKCIYLALAYTASPTHIPQPSS